MKTKLILGILLLIGGTIIVITRFINSAARKQSQNNLINKIKTKPAEAARYAEQLDMPVDTRTNINRQAFQIIKSKIQSSPAIGSYKIVYTSLIDESLLFFTELEYTDFDVTITGHADDVKKKAHHNFLLRHNEQEQQLTLRSDMFDNATGKMQKQEFIEALFKSTVG